MIRLPLALVPRWPGAAVLTLALLVTTARADDVAEVQRLAASGRVVAALQKVDEALAARPKDAQMRFLKGVILAENGRSAEAIELFRALTEDYPDLPEPYNNLAALYAAKGEHDQARTALEQAIRNNPGYATAYENLGDVYVAMAGRAYEQSLKLEPASLSVPPKLVLLRQLASPRARAPAMP